MTAREGDAYFFVEVVVVIGAAVDAIDANAVVIVAGAYGAIV